MHQEWMPHPCRGLMARILAHQAAAGHRSTRCTLIVSHVMVDEEPKLVEALLSAGSRAQTLGFHG